MKRLLLAIFIVLSLTGNSWAANKFWVLGTGSLDGVDTTHISDSDGGAGGAVYPSSSDTLNFTASSGGGTVTFTATANLGAIVSGAFTGTIDTNGQAVNLSGGGTFWNNSGTGTRTINFGASVITSSGVAPAWAWGTTTNLTFNAGTSSIVFSNSGNGVFQGGGLTYATVTFNTAVNFGIQGANTFGTLTLNGHTTTATPYLTANQTITGTFTLAGSNATAGRVLFRTNAKGTQYTVTAATVTVSNADFQDIVGAGAGSWDLSAITGLSGDCGGNSGITFTTPQTNYWQHGASASYNWSDSTRWFLGSGGTGGAGRVPLCQDTARFDSGSFSASGKTVVQDMPRIGAVDWTGVTNSPTWTTSTAASFFGSITLISGMTLTASTQTYTYEGRGSSTLTSAGKTWAKSTGIHCVTGTLTLGDAFTTTSSIVFDSGTFDTASMSVTSTHLTYSGANNQTLNLGASTWTMNGNTSIGIPPTLTLNAGTSTIRLTGAYTVAQTFAGASKTYYRLENATTGAFALQFTGSNTFQDGIYVDASAAARTVQFTGSTNTTVGRLGRLDSTTNVITLGPISGTFTLTKSGGGVVNLDYLTVSGSTGSPASTWYAGSHSTDGGSNSGWTFGPAPNRAFITDLLPEMKRAGASAPAHDQR